MHIAHGYTRHVLVTPSGAYKIAKFHFLFLPFRAIAVLLNKERRQRFMIRLSKEGLLAILWKQIFAGLLANRNEYRYYMKTADPRVVATKRMIFWGLVVVQEEASSITQEEFVNPLGSHPSLDGFEEVSHSHQFGRREGKVLLLDYGQKETCDLLECIPM